MARRTRLLCLDVTIISRRFVFKGIILPYLLRCNGTRLAPTLDVLERGNGHPLSLRDFFHIVKVIHTTRGPKKEGEQEEIVFFYGKAASLGWDPDRWRWKDGGCFLNYITKDGCEFITNSNPRSTRAGDTWQGYLPGNYEFYWSQIWDPFRSGKEAEFMWSIWHKAVVIIEWWPHCAGLDF